MKNIKTIRWVVYGFIFAMILLAYMLTVHNTSHKRIINNHAKTKIGQQVVYKGDSLKILDYTINDAGYVVYKLENDKEYKVRPIITY